MTPERQRLVAQLNQVLTDAGGNTTLDDLIQQAREGRVQIWSRGNSLAVTELLAFPQKTQLNVIAAAGKLTEIQAMEAEIEAFARAHGAASMVTHGRSAWARVGRRTGWVPVAMRFVKSLPQKNGELQ
jgi:hypothetical protein